MDETTKAALKLALATAEIILDDIQEAIDAAIINKPIPDHIKDSAKNLARNAVKKIDATLPKKFTDAGLVDQRELFNNFQAGLDEIFEKTHSQLLASNGHTGQVHAILDKMLINPADKSSAAQSPILFYLGTQIKHHFKQEHTALLEAFVNARDNANQSPNEKIATNHAIDAMQKAWADIQFQLGPDGDMHEIQDDKMIDALYRQLQEDLHEEVGLKDHMSESIALNTLFNTIQNNLDEMIDALEECPVSLEELEFTLDALGEAEDHSQLKQTENDIYAALKKVGKDAYIDRLNELTQLQTEEPKPATNTPAPNTSTALVPINTSKISAEYLGNQLWLHYIQIFSHVKGNNAKASANHLLEEGILKEADDIYKNLHTQFNLPEIARKFGLKGNDDYIAQSVDMFLTALQKSIDTLPAINHVNIIRLQEMYREQIGPMPSSGSTANIADHMIKSYLITQMVIEYAALKSAQSPSIWDNRNPPPSNDPT